jgi:phage terminase large subunit-like protein
MKGLSFQEVIAMAKEATLFGADPSCGWIAGRMVGSSPALQRRVGIPINNLHVATTASRFMPLSSDASSMDGLNVHGAIVEELHAHRTRHVVDVLETATGAR